eukprot:m.56332 g.56332  ORF g.56332 m.56332 type:complete len:489 (-) comp22232_c1_seq2:76-1542(-)
MMLHSSNKTESLSRNRTPMGDHNIRVQTGPIKPLYRPPFNVSQEQTQCITLDGVDPGKKVPQNVNSLRSLVRALSEQLRHERSKVHAIIKRNSDKSENTENKLPVSDLVNVNVGGTLFTTRMSTLTRVPESYLSTLFSGDFPVDVDDTNSVFIDRSPKYFGIILDWLRDDSTVTRDWPVDDPAFLHEVLYFGLHDAMFGRSHIYIAGGQTNVQGDLTNEVIRYDHVRDVWTSCASIPGERSWHSCVSRQDGDKMMMLCGRGPDMKACKSAYSFDPENREWETMMPPTNARSSFGMVSYGNRVFVIGGVLDDVGPTDCVECYDFETKTWCRKSNMPSPRARMACCISDGMIYVMGGCNSLLEPPNASVLRYDIDKDTWSELQSMLSPRRYVDSVTVNGSIYAIGGTTTGTIMEEYDPAKNMWQPCPQPNVRRHAPVCVVLNGRIFVCGGTNHDTVLSSVEVYCPKSKSWTEAAPMPSPIFAAAACTLSI